jgi:hypothetical protein
MEKMKTVFWHVALCSLLKIDVSEKPNVSTVIMKMKKRVPAYASASSSV